MGMFRTEQFVQDCVAMREKMEKRRQRIYPVMLYRLCQIISVLGGIGLSIMIAVLIIGTTIDITGADDVELRAYIETITLLLVAGLATVIPRLAIRYVAIVHRGKELKK